MSLSTDGIIPPFVNVICASPPAVTVITSEPENAMDVFVSPSPVMLSSCMSPALVKLESLRSNVPVTSRLPSTVTLPANVAAPVTPSVPDISALPFISIVVAFISISVSDTRSRTPSAD